MMVDYELNELRREFLQEAGEKVSEMQQALDSGSRERLAYLAHQLKGSGGSYGYQRISSEAAEIERAVEKLVEDRTDDGTDAALEAKMQQAVVNLRAEVQKAARELATAPA